jgi:hypothetical protein
MGIDEPADLVVKYVSGLWAREDQGKRCDHVGMPDLTPPCQYDGGENYEHEY